MVPFACRAVLDGAIHLFQALPSWISKFRGPIYLGETHCYFNRCDFFCSFHTFVEVQFGGLSRLNTATNNYRDNMNALYCHADMTLFIEQALRNIIVCAYVHYIDTWVMNEACMGHRAVLMHSMLSFALHLGWYRWWEKHFTRGSAPLHGHLCHLWM